jgi:dimethylglycine dehydrogenase
VVKAKEDYCLRHEIPFPHFNRLAGRPVKPSPLYETLKAKGAVFEEVYGHRTPALVRQRRCRAARITIPSARARDILAPNTPAALDNTSFRWLTAQEIEVAGRKLWAFRMSYAGELGWEFHVPREDMLAVYDALWATGEALGLADYGSFAMNALRLEKGFKGAGELTNEVTLPEADVMRFVKLDKGDFLGREETETSAESALPWVCVYLEVEPDGVADGHGGEAVLMNGNVVGATSSIAYGHSVGKILAFAYVKPEAAEAGTELEVVVMNGARAARVLNVPAYDPDSILPRTDAQVGVAAE